MGRKIILPLLIFFSLFLFFKNTWYNPELNFSPSRAKEPDLISNYEDKIQKIKMLLKIENKVGFFTDRESLFDAQTGDYLPIFFLNQYVFAPTILVPNSLANKYALVYCTQACRLPFKSQKYELIVQINSLHLYQLWKSAK